jgi:SAM-dependent methyltransferase
MPSIAEHYESHLAPIYVWMTGGLEAAISRGRSEIEAVCPRASQAEWAVDLGAGFGMHALPLADIGYSVLALDSSSTLLDVMKSRVTASAIIAVQDNLLSFKKYLPAKAALFVCMGDTLTHLLDRNTVDRLFADVAEMLSPGGMFVVTFRDYSIPLIGSERFIPVRCDSNRILTCFLEYESEAVMVHDIIHERLGSEWRQRVSAYRKLRLSPDWVVSTLEAKGFQVKRESGLAGMVRLVAKLP